MLRAGRPAGIQGRGGLGRRAEKWIGVGGLLSDSRLRCRIDNRSRLSGPRARPIVGRLARLLPAQFLLIVPATVILYLVSSVAAPGSLSASAMLTVACFASILAVAAIGQTLVVQQGGLDLSVPGVISLAAVLVTKFPAGDNGALGIWIIAALACGAVSGLICGVVITRFFVTPLVATLAVNALLYGTVLYLTKGTSTEGVPSDRKSTR